MRNKETEITLLLSVTKQPSPCNLFDKWDDPTYGEYRNLTTGPIVGSASCVPDSCSVKVTRPGPMREYLPPTPTS